MTIHLLWDQPWNREKMSSTDDERYETAVFYIIELTTAALLSTDDEV